MLAWKRRSLYVEPEEEGIKKIKKTLDKQGNSL